MDFSLVTWFERLATDFSLDPLTVKYCTNRIKNEGAVFLTSVLPSFGKVLLYALETGSFRSSRDDLRFGPKGFTSIQKQGGLLKYFRGYLMQIFSVDGTLLENPCPVAIYALRQICEYFYKLAVPFSEEQLQESENNFVATEKEVADAPLDWQFVDQLRKDLLNNYKDVANVNINQIFDAAKPRAGPGTYSTRFLHRTDIGKMRVAEPVIRPVSRIRLERPFFERRGHYSPVDLSVEGVYKPYPGCPKRILRRYTHKSEHGPKFIIEPKTGVRFATVGRGLRTCLTAVEPVSEVLFVPKDSRGPRVIVREPYDLLIHQMAFQDWLIPVLEKSTHGHIQFLDQTKFRELAREGSLNGKWATLDLKEASDRVSYRLIKHLFKDCPGVREFLFRYRTHFTCLPSGQVLRLAKLSGMGSGFTFPLMSLLIHLSIVRGIVNHAHISYKEAAKHVFVYGDDIIVSSRYRTVAEQSLQKVGLKVNISKSYSSGGFRESCGGDYFHGNDVTPVRLRLSSAELFVSGTALSVKGSFDLLSIERHARELVRAGFSRVPDYLYGVLERCLRVTLPKVAGESPVLGRYTMSTPNYPMDETGAYGEIRALLPVAKTFEGYEDPYVFLAKSLGRQVPSFKPLLETLGPPKDRGLYAMPRTVRYRWTDLSAFRLMG